MYYPCISCKLCIPLPSACECVGTNTFSFTGVKVSQNLNIDNVVQILFMHSRNQKIVQTVKNQKKKKKKKHPPKTAGRANTDKGILCCYQMYIAIKLSTRMRDFVFAHLLLYLNQ